jgi:putative ABC transport system ATP-binding protein
MMNKDAILKVKNVHKSYSYDHTRQEILHGINFEVQRGEFVAVMGPSGCGKSTLLHILGLMLPIDDAEELSIDGTDTLGLSQAQRTEVRRNKIGFVFQRFNLLDILTAEDNLKLAFKLRGMKPETEKVCATLNMVGLAEKLRRKPHQMSIGEQQRLAIARAVIHRPALLLADEPTGNLDTDNADNIIELLKSFNKQFNQTIIMVTHNPELAERADRLVTMKDGRIVR